jgi:hypothetical protein
LLIQIRLTFTQWLNYCSYLGGLLVWGQTFRNVPFALPVALPRRNYPFLPRYRCRTGHSLACIWTFLFTIGN